MYFIHKILVTGAGGFIGNAMVNYLKDMDYWVRGVDIKRPQFSSTRADEFLIKDLRKYDQALESTIDVNGIFSLAANMGGIGYITSKSADIVHDNSKINANMLKASVKNGIDRFFFSSSACVYPDDMQSDSSRIVSLKESDAYPVNPGTPYGWEKHFTEIMCEGFREDYGLETRIGRFHNLFGPEGDYKSGREKAPAALCRKVAKAEEGSSVVVWGDGSQIRSFLYIDDAVEGIFKLFMSDISEPLNIGNDEAIRIDDLVDLIIDISGKDLSKGHDLSKPQGVASRNANIGKIKHELGWSPSTDYREGMTKTYEWIKNEIRSSRSG